MTDNQKNKIALEDRAENGNKLYSPSTARNRDPIRDVFLKFMPLEGKILEIGGGTGEHAIHIASKLPNVVWHTGDPDETSRASIAAWIEDAGLSNVKGPHSIDVRAEDWGIEAEAPFDGLVSINMIHIAPITAAEGLFAGAQRILAPAGKFFLYGPFSKGGIHISPSNEAFDQSLKSRDPRWGVRDIDADLLPLAKKNGLILQEAVEMPANNLSLIFRKS
ncbi:DUF938 domain-containing protein [Hyphococcus formosus]|uniref:DUF938 domain-containing protein n=1 Tax=Hyphococcus formosus TaxID=3143534 RepID=UPI00398B243F